MDSFAVNEKNASETYIAPDPDFISAISFFSSSLPWDRFETFFKSRKLVNLSSEEQLILLRFLAVQELLCLNDPDLLSWLKNQFYLFSFLQPGFKPRLPTVKLLKQFRSELDNIGLLEPFRKHCQHIIQEHSQRFPAIKTPLASDRIPDHFARDKSKPETSQKPEQGSHLIEFTQSLISKTNDSVKKPAHEDSNTMKSVESHSKVNDFGNINCENCGSQDFINLKSSQKESSLPAIRFIRCRICGNTFRA